MVSDIVLDALRHFRYTEPFKPFELVFRDGRRAQILWPDAVGWHAGADKLSYAAPDDSFIHEPLSDLVEVRPLGHQGSGTAA